MLKVKAFVRTDGTVTITCPVCKTSKNATVAQFRNKKHTIDVNCICKTPFTVTLDFRMHYRKKVDLPGAYQIVTPAGAGRGAVRIKNISMSGVGFTVTMIGGLEKGQIVELDFKLADRKQTRMVRQARILTIDNGYLGCQFSDNDPYERDLGYFLST